MGVPMIYDTYIESDIPRRVPVMGCSSCKNVFSVVLYPPDQNGEPGLKPLGRVKVCPICGEVDNANSESVNLPTGGKRA